MFVYNKTKKQYILDELNILEKKVTRTEEEIIKKLSLDMSTERTGLEKYPTKDLLILRKEELRERLKELSEVTE